MQGRPLFLLLLPLGCLSPSLAQSSVTPALPTPGPESVGVDEGMGQEGRTTLSVETIGWASAAKATPTGTTLATAIPSPADVSAAQSEEGLPPPSHPFTPLVIVAMIGSALLLVLLIGVVGYRLKERRARLTHPRHYTCPHSYHPSPPLPSLPHLFPEGLGARRGRPRASTFESYSAPLPPPVVDDEGIPPPPPAHHSPMDSTDWASGSITEGYSLSMVTAAMAGMTTTHTSATPTTASPTTTHTTGHSSQHPLLPLYPPPRPISDMETGSVSELLALRHRSESNATGWSIGTGMSREYGPGLGHGPTHWRMGSDLRGGSSSHVVFPDQEDRTEYQVW